MTQQPDKPHVYDANLRENSDLQNFFEGDPLVVATRFFRNKELFDQIRTIVIPRLIKTGLEKRGVLRVWSAGCSDGREVYSLVMACRSILTDLGFGSIKVEARGSDVSRPQINIARDAIYRINKNDEEVLNLFSYYFDELDKGMWRVKQSIRASIKFVVEDITKIIDQEPFDILICSLVVLYYEPDFQKQIIKGLLCNVREDGFFHVVPVGRRWMKTQGFVPALGSGPFFVNASSLSQA